MISTLLAHVRLLAFAWSLSHDLDASRAIVTDVLDVTADPWRARWLVEWSYHESRWRTGVVDVTGATHGRMQVDPSIWGPVPDDGAGQLEQAIEVLDMLTEACGTRRRAL